MYTCSSSSAARWVIKMLLCMSLAKCLGSTSLSSRWIFSEVLRYLLQILLVHYFIPKCERYIIIIAPHPSLLLVWTNCFAECWHRSPCSNPGQRSKISRSLISLPLQNDCLCANITMAFLHEWLVAHMLYHRVSRLCGTRWWEKVSGLLGKHMDNR